MMNGLEAVYEVVFGNYVSKPNLLFTFLLTWIILQYFITTS